jgi:hypothetical protein
MVLLTALACNPPSKDSTTSSVSLNAQLQRDTTQLLFWKGLHNLCGNAYEGTIIAGSPNDTVFAGKRLLMHVRQCSEQQVKIPFFVGNDSSRTWIFTWEDSGLLLKHDHRHADGTPDAVTMYGGKTTNFGSATCQLFPTDLETAQALPYTIANVWWIDLVPGESFTYNLRRVNTDRIFSVRFDLKNPVEAPGKPWGWQD